MKYLIFALSVLMLSCQMQPASAKTKPITNIITENTFTVAYNSCFYHDEDEIKKYVKRKFGIELDEAINYRLNYSPIGDGCEITYKIKK